MSIKNQLIIIFNILISNYIGLENLIALLKCVHLHPNQIGVSMRSGHYVFAQITKFLPKRYFERLTVKYDDHTRRWSITHWNHLLVLMFGQMLRCRSLRELTDIIVAHANKSFFLGFRKCPVNRQILSKANSIRDYRIFEEFAFHEVAIPQSKRLTKEFELHGRIYAVDSTTIDLCLSVLRQADCRTTKSGIRNHTQIDIVTEIPVFYRITNTQVHHVNFMDWLTYEPLACYVFDRGYFDLARLYEINCSEAFFIIREKFHPNYEIESRIDLEERDDNVLRDHTVRFNGKRNKTNYIASFRRIVYYSPDLRRTFTYYTNIFYLEAKNNALLYKYRKQV